MFKNPILVIGILFMLIFLLDMKRQGKFIFARNLESTPCRGASVMLKKRIPANWALDCNGNNMNIKIKLEAKPAFNLNVPAEVLKLKSFLYRELANNLISISKNSPPDILEKVFFITLVIEHPQLQISALSEGKYVAKLSGMTDSKFIAEHLQATVKVQEKLKP